LACSRIGLTSSASMSSWVSRCSKDPVLLKFAARGLHRLGHDRDPVAWLLHGPGDGLGLEGEEHRILRHRRYPSASGPLRFLHRLLAGGYAPRTRPTSQQGQAAALPARERRGVCEPGEYGSGRRGDGLARPSPGRPSRRVMAGSNNHYERRRRAERCARGVGPGRHRTGSQLRLRWALAE
jgi:hypothetical protein